MISKTFQKYSSIVVDRQGRSPNAFMRTVNIVGEISPRSRYQIRMDQLMYVSTDLCRPKTIRPKNDLVVNYAVFEGRWNQGDNRQDSSNILGGVGTLTVDTTRLIIPEIPTTSENLAFYGAHLYNIGEMLVFDTETDIPVTIMKVGDNYVQDYIMSEDGANGVYLEHHDRPHFHMPLNREARGHLILGKSCGPSFIISAFKIPFGKAIYTPPNIIHNDCFLIGDYLVVYSFTPNFSTVRLVNTDNVALPVTISC